MAAELGLCEDLRQGWKSFEASCLGVGAGVHENLPSYFPPQVFICSGGLKFV